MKRIEYLHIQWKLSSLKKQFTHLMHKSYEIAPIDRNTSNDYKARAISLKTKIEALSLKALELKEVKQKAG